MTKRHQTAEELLIGTRLPPGPRSHLIGHPFTRQRRILLTANQPITGSIKGGPAGSEAVFTGRHLRQGRRPCHTIITMMNTVWGLWRTPLLLGDVRWA